MMPLTSTSATFSTDFNFNYGGYHVGEPTRESRLSSSAPLSPTSPVASMTNRYDELSLSKQNLLMKTMNYPGIPSTPAANHTHNPLTSIEEDTKLSITGSPNDNALRVMVSCNNCKRAKTKCDHGRPCTRCVRTGRSSTCVDAVHKKRGRKRSWVNKGGDGDSSSSATTPVNEHASPPKLSNKLLHRQQHQRATTEPGAKSSPSSTPVSPFRPTRERAYTYSGPDPSLMAAPLQPLQPPSLMQPIVQQSYAVPVVPQNLQSYQYPNVSLDWSTTVPVHPEYIRDRSYSDTQPWGYNNNNMNNTNNNHYFHVSASVPMKDRTLIENPYYSSQSQQTFSVPLKERSISNNVYIPQYHQKDNVMNSYVQSPNDNDIRSTVVEGVQFQMEKPLPILAVEEEESFAFKRARRGSTTLKNLRVNIQRHQPQQQQQPMDLGAPSTPCTAPPFLFEPYDISKFNNANDGYIPQYSQQNALSLAQQQHSFPRTNNQNTTFAIELNPIAEDRYIKPESTSMSTENIDSNPNRLLDIAWSQFSAEAPILGRRNSRRLSIFTGELFTNGPNAYGDSSYAPCFSRQTSRRLSVFAGDLLGPSSSFDYPVFTSTLESSELLPYPNENLHPHPQF